MDDVVPVRIPRLVTERLVLRAPRRDDFDAYAASAADAEFATFLGGPVDGRLAWRLFCAQIGGWMLGAGGWLAITVPGEDRMLGIVGAFRRESAPEVVEIGWSVFRSHWRKGYAAEAAQAMVDLAFDAWDEPRVIAYIDAKNEASKGVARRLGMTSLGPSSFYGEPCDLFELRRAR